MRYLVLLFSVAIIGACNSTVDNSELQNRINEIEISDQLSFYLHTVPYKTHLEIVDIGFSMEESLTGDSSEMFIVFQLEPLANPEFKIEDYSLDHRINQFVSDIKPMLNELGQISGVKISYENDTGTEFISVGMERNFSFHLKEFKGMPLFTYSHSGDTLIIQDHFFNGQKSCTGSIFNARQTGHWKYFFPNGQIRKSGKFVNGEYYGEWLTWDERGNKI